MAQKNTTSSILYGDCRNHYEQPFRSKRTGQPGPGGHRVTCTGWWLEARGHLPKSELDEVHPVQQRRDEAWAQMSPSCLLFTVMTPLGKKREESWISLDCLKIDLKTPKAVKHVLNGDSYWKRKAATCLPWVWVMELTPTIWASFPSSSVAMETHGGANGQTVDRCLS